MRLSAGKRIGGLWVGASTNVGGRRRARTVSAPPVPRAVQRARLKEINSRYSRPVRMVSWVARHPWWSALGLIFLIALFVPAQH